MTTETKTELVWVAPTDLVASSLNPRKRFLQSALVEMADSIVAKGVQVPLKARPGEAGKLEIIWGERRWRGAMLVYQGYEDAAGTKHGPREDLRIPVLVESLADEEVFELMMLENLQRADLSPCEEGAGYQRMMDEFGLSLREVAARLGVERKRVQRLTGLLDLPNSVMERIDAGDLPVYVALEALRVPAEWGGGEARMEALRLAEEAGSPARAHELVEARYLRPVREASTWESEDCLRGLLERFGDGVERLAYSTSRDLFPAGVTVLTPVTAGNFVLAEEVPAVPTVHFEVTSSWGDLAREWGAPLFVACDGSMNPRLLARADLVAEAGRSRCTREVELVEAGGLGSGRWRWLSPDDGLVEGDRVALLKLSGRGEVPLGFGAGRLYVVSGVESAADGSGLVFDLAEARNGAVLPVSGVSAARLGLLDVSRCPFLPVEGRMAADALRMESSEAGAAADAADRARQAKLAEMLGATAMAVRGSVAAGSGNDGLLAKAVQFLAATGAVGLSHEEHPSNRLMALLEVPEEEDGAAMFSTWQGLDGPAADRAGAESFAVCSWLLYWLEQHDGEDLEVCEHWKVVRQGYRF